MCDPLTFPNISCTGSGPVPIPLQIPCQPGDRCSRSADLSPIRSGPDTAREATAESSLVAMTIGSISASAGAHFPGRRQEEPHDRSHREGAKRVWEGIGAPGRSVLPRAHPKPPELGCADSHQTVRR